MKSIKLMLLGIAVILAGIALSTNNIFGYVGGAVGLLAAMAGMAVKSE